MKDSNGYGVASLVLSIIGLFLPFLGVILGILAIIFAVKQNKKYKNGVAMSGLIIGIIGTCMWGIWVLLIVGISSFAFI